MRVVAAILAAFATFSAFSGSDEPSLARRVTRSKQSEPWLRAETRVQGIVIKLHEGTNVRLRDRLRTISRDARALKRLQELGLTDQAVNADLDSIRAILSSSARVTGPLRRHFRVPEESLAQARAEGETASGEELA